MRTLKALPPSPDPWLTASEAAEYLRLPSVAALYQRRARGQVKGNKWGRTLRFRRSELDAVMRADGRP